MICLNDFFDIHGLLRHRLQRFKGWLHRSTRVIQQICDQKNSFDLQSRKEAVIVVIVQNVRPGRRTLKTLALIANFTRFFEQASGSTSTASADAEKYVGSHDGARWHEVKCQWEAASWKIPLQDFTSRQFNGPNTPPFSALRDQHARSPRH